MSSDGLLASVFSDVASVAQALSLLLVAATFAYTVKQVRHLGEQLRQESRARRLQSTREVLQEIGEDRVRRARSWVLSSSFPRDPVQSLQGETREEALRLAVAYDRVGLMVRHDLVDREMVIEWHGQEIALIWQRVGPLILDERERRGTSGYCQYIELLKDCAPPPPPVPVADSAIVDAARTRSSNPRE